jgi:hypothetical protein
MMSGFKRFLLRILPGRLVTLLAGIIFVLEGNNVRLSRKLENSNRHQRMLARQLLSKYAPLAVVSERHHPINEHELAVHSQNGEDGILLHIFSVIGAQDHQFVEIGVGDGTQCNTANLAINFGWKGLLIEGDRELAQRARRFYQRQPGIAERVIVRGETVTAENVDQILADEGLQGEIDLLSIDVDGNDYWIWRAMTSINPRVVVIEYNASLGNERAIVVEYDGSTDHRSKHYSGFYHGASLVALTKLAREKGYALLGCESAGVNAFFVREDLVTENTPRLAPETAYFPHEFRTRQMTVDDQWQLISKMPFVNV